MFDAIENPLFLIPILTGVIFLSAGGIMLIFPPKKINDLYGYRTRNAMKNQERWDFAQLYGAKELMKSGAILIVLSTIGLVFHPADNLAAIIGLGFLIIAVVIMFSRVESALKRKFGSE